MFLVHNWSGYGMTSWSDYSGVDTTTLDLIFSGTWSSNIDSEVAYHLILLLLLLNMTTFCQLLIVR